jgi:LacI family transcriptional regulator
MSSSNTTGRLAAATVVDVAEHAGVSRMTVSRALSGNGYVSAAAKAKVKEAVEALGYIPNISAKVLKHTRTNVLGMLVSELRSPQIAQVVSSVGLATKRAGQDLFICLAAGDPADESPTAINHLLAGICDGILIALPKTPAVSLQLIERSGVPAVLVDYAKGGTKLATVRGDNYNSAFAATQHLLDLGHRRIAFIAGSSYSGQSAERQRGYVDALQAAGIAVDPSLMPCGEFERPLGQEMGRQLLIRPDRPTAIFAANDEMALGVYDAARDLGLAVPGDVSLVGFDDIPAAGYRDLTTVRESVQEIADTAVRTLLRQIETRVPTSQCIQFPNELVVRGSSGPAPRKIKAARAS